MIGSTLSHFKITSKLGEGGMGEVWRAEDTRLGRDVALKMLPESLAQDAERLARFEREARVLASLSHPNIAGIFGLEEDDGRRFLVMEVAEGETLAERIARGPIAPQPAVRIALQIAEALEVAHAKGVVHRDLKPANVKLASDGSVKVLDFGLAKALDGDPESDPTRDDLSLSPTLTRAMTMQGALLGTAGYMSPEQARAQPVDRRADIWAFGCVLYEMLTGERTFKGDTATDILGAIVHKEPELERLPAGLSPRLRRLIERCLRKDAERRLQAIGDARVALQEWLENPQEPADSGTVSSSRPSRRWLPWATAAAGAALAWIAAGLWLGDSTAVREPVRRFEQAIPEGRVFLDFGPGLSLSRDGSRLAYNVLHEGPSLALDVRSLDQLSGTTIVSGNSETTVGVMPFFSPDGQWLAYFSDGLVKTVPGGSPIRLAELERASGGDWSESDLIVYSHDGDGPDAEGLYLIPAAGGDRKSLTSTPYSEASHEHHRWPQWLPGGRSVLFTVVQHGENAETRIEVVDVASGERKLVHRGGFYARYVETGHLLFASESTIFALAFDLDRLEASGAPMPVLQGVFANEGNAAAAFSVSKDGLLAYVADSGAAQEFPIVWADRQGTTEMLLDTPGIYGGPMLSPSGDRLAVSQPRGDNWDVWVFDIERGVSTRLTFGEGYDADIAWSPDGRYIAFTSDREGGATIFRKRSDGSGEAERLLEPGKVWFPSPLSWHPDGRHLMIVASPSDGQAPNLYTLDVETGEITPTVSSERPVTAGFYSPDGRYLVYRSNESGEPQVYVRSLEGEGRWQVSRERAAQPRWSRDGKELFFRGTRGMMRVEVDTSGDTLRLGRPEVLFQGPLGDMFGVQVPGYQFHDYDVAPDGRFVVLPRRVEGDEATSTVRFVTGWFSELRALTGSGE